MGVCRKLGISFSCFLGAGLIKCLDQLLAQLWICVQETSRDHFELIVVVIASEMSTILLKWVTQASERLCRHNKQEKVAKLLYKLLEWHWWHLKEERRQPKLLGGTMVNQTLTVVPFLTLLVPLESPQWVRGGAPSWCFNLWWKSLYWTIIFHWKFI
jgi:hypothetical protein